MHMIFVCATGDGKINSLYKLSKIEEKLKTNSSSAHHLFVIYSHIEQNNDNKKTS